MRNFYKNLKNLIFFTLLLLGVGNVWANTWTANVGVGSGTGSAYAEVYSDAIVGSGVKSTSATTTNSTTKQATWSSTFGSTKGHCIFHATAGTGYSFSGWYTASDCSGNATSASNSYSTSSNKGGTYTYYAKFSPNSYDVTLNANGGKEGDQVVSATYDASMPSTKKAGGNISKPTKDGYTFAGYYDAKSGGTQYYDKDLKSARAWNYADKKTLYAHWTANTYTVHFDGNGATSGSMDNQEFTYDAAKKALSAFTSFERVYTVAYDANATGASLTASASNTTATYQFTEWNTKADGTGSAYKDKASVNNLAYSGTFNLYAQWKSDFVTLPTATKTGGVLKAWYNGNDSIGEAGAKYIPTANVTLTAHWIDKYTPEFTGSDQNMKVGDKKSGIFTFAHTNNPTVHISDTKVISYDAKTNTVEALSAGTATIYFEQAETSSLFYKKSDTWTFTVTRIDNTLALTATSATRYVDQEVTGIIQTTNSDATVQTSSSDATIAYYDVDKNKIVIPNSSAKSFANTTVTIKIWQAQTVKYNASGEKTFTLTVNKYPTSFTGSDYNLMVDGTQVANYNYTNTSVGQPTANSADNFYYTIDEVNFTNSAKNKGTDLVVFDPSNKQITAKNAGTAKITLHQKETYKHTGATKSFNVAVYKYNSAFANANNLEVKVGANVTSSYTLTYSKPNNAYVSTEVVSAGTPTLNSGDFYYTLTHNVTTSNTEGSTDPTKAIEYTASSKKAEGKNAGTATIHLYQTETYKYNAADASFIVTVTKNDPVFTWNSSNSAYYHNTSISNIFSSSNKDCAYTIGASTNASVAIVDGNTLKILTKDGNADFTVTQAANYKWSGKSQTYTVTPTSQSNHVPFTISNSNYTTFRSSTSSNVTWSNPGFRLCDGGWFEKDDEVVIAFTGIPDKLTFDRVLGKSLGQLPGTYECHVYASANGSSWGEAIWTLNERTENASANVQVPATARYLKFTYHGTVYCYYNNIKVTELKKFTPNPATLDFGALDINTTGSATQKTFEFNYANVGHNVTLSTNDAHFTVSPTSITNIGGEKTGKTTVTVNYSTAELHKATNAKLTITDELGNSTNVTLKGETKKLTPTVNWSTSESIFIEDDELSATNANGLTVTLSVPEEDAQYVHCEGNTATIVGYRAGTITVTATVTGNDIYNGATFTKDITITNLTKQTITWTQDLSHFKTTDQTKSITLNGTASSGLPVTYELQGDKTGLTLTQNGNIWTLTYSTECKNTTLVAKQGGNNEYAPAASVSIPVRVIDPTTVCDSGETLVNSSITLKGSSVTYNIDIPASMSISLERIKKGIYVYLRGVDVEFYDGKNGTGTKLYTKSYAASDIDKSISNASIDLSGYIKAKSVKITTDASYGYYLNSLTYTKRKYCTISDNSLEFETYPNTVSSTKTFMVNYANYPISVESSNSKFTVTPTSFGDCDEYGTKTISVYYTAGAAEGNDNGYIYIKDNTGVTLKTCTLSVAIQKLTQSITSTNIQNAYSTTDKVTLSAEANSGLTSFTYSATPAGIASFNGNEMTFLKSGTITITVAQEGTNVYNPTSTTISNIVVNKAEPNIATAPTATSLVYQQTLNKSTLSGGAADATFRGVAHTAIEGEFAWTNPMQQVTENAGSHNYSVTFTPTNTEMYTTTTFTIPINITRAEQSILMNNGAVKVAVDGLDAGSADSKLDLDDLINWQSSEVVNDVERTGSVSYSVISDNKSASSISEGNIFSATQVGEYTIRATKVETDYYAQATKDFTVTVGKRANTLTIAGTEYEQFVEDVVTGIRLTQNSDAQVKTSSTYPTIAYYDVESNEIRIPNSASEDQMFGDQKKVTITIWQDATERFEASGEKEITLTVKKYATSLTGSDYVVKVNGTITAGYAFTNTSAALPSTNTEDDFYYTIDQPNFENVALNNGEDLITYNPATNQITGYNAGTTKITFFQNETYKYAGATLMCNIAVEKKENKINNTWSNTWQKAMDENATLAVSFTSTHGDYTNYPIAIEQIYGEDVATLAGTSIQTNTTHGYAIWHISQAENYEYYAAEADLMVMVGVPAPPTCYVYEDNNEHSFVTKITDAEGHFDTPIAINSPIDKIWYSAKKDLLGYNYFAVQYSTDNGTTWNQLSSPDLGSDYAEYSATFPTMTGNTRITHVRFGAKTGATLYKYYKDVRISRKAYLTIQDAEQKSISKLPTMECTIDETSTSEAKFYIDYSTCDDEIIIESSNTAHFTVNRTKITTKGDNLTSAKEEVTVTYNSAELGTHSGVITIRTSYQTRALSVSGETSKRTPTLTWQEGYTSNPLTLPIGLTVNAIKPAATSSSLASVIYSSDNENVVQILEGGYAFKVVGLGSATLTATSPENDKWKSVNDTRVIHATEKTVQEIVWNQTFPRFMAPGEVFELDAKVFLHNLSTEVLTYSEERTQSITYSCPNNNGVVSINENQMTILNYGEVKIKASVGGNADYEAATPVSILVIVRQPSAGDCETPLVLHKEDVMDMFEVNVDFSDYSNLTTQEMVSSEIKIDQKNGKPDKLSFQYEGEEYKFGLLSFFSGVIKFEQRVNSVWTVVAGSRVETVKNEWNTLSNLQLDENADALRIIRERGATGHHKIKEIQVTRKQYLRASQTEINLGEVKSGQEKTTSIGFDYSDVKGDLTAHAINNTTNLILKDNGAIDLECGSFGHYDLQVTFNPDQKDTTEWQGTVEVYDNIANMSISVVFTATVIPNEQYVFNHPGNWSDSKNWTTDNVPESADVTIQQNQNVNVNAGVSSITIDPAATVTVLSGYTLQIGDGTPTTNPDNNYGNLYVEDGGQVVLAEGATLNVNDFIIEASLGKVGENEEDDIQASSGQVTNNYNHLNVFGDAYFKLTFDPSGQVTYGFYDFTVPFDVNINGGIFKDGDLEQPMRNNVDFQVGEFDEAKYAQGQRPWVRISNTLKAGKLYTITFDADRCWNTIVFKKKAGSQIGSSTSESVCSGSTSTCGWNGIGNGMLYHGYPSNENKLQTYDHATNTYNTVVGLKTFAVGSAMFVQVGASGDIAWTAADATEERPLNAPKRQARIIEEFRLSLKAEGRSRALDQLWVSASEDATNEYTIGHDLHKMGTPTDSKVARMWATNGGLQLCDAELPLVSNKANVSLLFYAPQVGNYSIEIEEAPADATLYLTYNNRVIWNLSMSPYELELTQGTTEGYGLRIVAAQQTTTDLENDGLINEANGIRKVLIDDKIYLVTPEGAMYDVLGKGVKY